MRDHLRALFVTAHIVVVVVLGFPQPGNFMHKKMWRHPDAQAAFRTASRGLRAVGIDAPPEAVEARAWALGTAWKQGRRRTVQHIYPYVKYCGVKQGWSMFASVPRKSGRLEIAVEEGGAWRDVYIAQDPERQWAGTQLRQERVRGYISDFAWRRARGRFPLFAKAVAWRAAEDFPDATRLRVRMQTLHIPEPAALRQAGALRLGEPYYTTELDLSEYR